MSNWFCNQAVCGGGEPWWRVRGMLPRMMGMTKPRLHQSEAWKADLSTNGSARLAAGWFPCVSHGGPLTPHRVRSRALFPRSIASHHNNVFIGIVLFYFDFQRKYSQYWLLFS